MIFSGTDIQTPLILAPLAGWTDSPFRRLCKRYGADILVSEMVSADGIVRTQSKTFDLVRFSELERPIGIQLFGSEPDILAEAARKVSEFLPDFIDLNFGCPARKVVKKGAGAALLKDLRLSGRIARAVVQATTIPISAKIRSGWDSLVAVEASQILEQSGVSFLTVHPRTQKMLFTGHADWSVIASVKRAVSIPVIGNGDIGNAADAESLLQQTSCDGVMIGRAARGNPWIFREIRARLEQGVALPRPSVIQRIEMALEHLDLAHRDMDASDSAFSIRKHLAFYLKGLPNATELRALLFRMKVIEEMKGVLQEYLINLQQQPIEYAVA